MTTHPRSPSTPARRTPQRVAVVGGGIVGLSVAWHLQRYDVDVIVLEQGRIGEGASWGNAGWLTPALARPLPDPHVLRFGLRALLDPASPVYLPPTADPATWRFLLGFARHCTAPAARRAMAALAPLNRQAIAAFDELADVHAVPRTRDAQPFLACFGSTQEAMALVRELQDLEEHGQRPHFDYLTGPQVHAAEPALGAGVAAAVALRGQRYLHPPLFVASLRAAVEEAGGVVREGSTVTGVRRDVAGLRVVTATGEDLRVDAVVLCGGAGSGDLLREHGVRRPVQAGRGYSFSVTGAEVPSGPVYFPVERIACTPLHDPWVTERDEQWRPLPVTPRLRIAGMMEFRPHGAPLDPRRIEAIVAAVRPLLPGVDLDDRQDEWVGSRPCTTDGLPLIGPTRTPGVHVATGHGMWGVVHGPLTGRLLAEQVVTGRASPLLRPFRPTR